ncbi:MAG: nucleotidyl transferase AbiEii/AbiGii toxin family protein [Caldilineaceae bacterium]|nr:nucleotidyl transferase AbiEii/AbiGii toxin family protein [Caldilineaceae bacterium]
MATDYLHNHPDFADLIRIVSEERAIVPALVEKDYWIMQCLHGLQQLNLHFELKGGTSLSKGFGIIKRFSEDIDIRIEPPQELDVKVGRNHSKPAHVESRRRFYDWLAETIRIDGVSEVARDYAFDDRQFRSGGIRLYYVTKAEALSGLKEGILLEVGFDDVIPNLPTNISSWAYDYAVDKVEITDNRAKGVACYHPGYTFVEKLQTISTKYRQQQESGAFPVNFMRHYYDVYCLLQAPDVQAFISTAAYHDHKQKRFRTGDNPQIAENEAFLLSVPDVRRLYQQAFAQTAALYYQEQPTFDEILQAIAEIVEML